MLAAKITQLDTESPPRREFHPGFFVTSRSGKTTPRYIAIHEAGHAVAHEAMCDLLPYRSRPFGRVYIRTPEEIAADSTLEWGGLEAPAIVWLSSGKYFPATCNDFGAEKWNKLLAEMKREMLMDAVIAYAGPLAEAKQRRMDPYCAICEAGVGDYTRVLSVTADFSQNLQEQQDFVEASRQIAAELLSKNWKIVKRLADVLLEERSLDGRTVRNMIDRWRSE